MASAGFKIGPEACSRANVIIETLRLADIPDSNPAQRLDRRERNGNRGSRNFKIQHGSFPNSRLGLRSRCKAVVFAAIHLMLEIIAGFRGIQHDFNLVFGFFYFR